MVVEMSWMFTITASIWGWELSIKLTGDDAGLPANLLAVRAGHGLCTAQRSRKTTKSDCCLIHQNSTQLPTITKTAVKFQGSVLGSRKPEPEPDLKEPELRVWPKVLCPSRTGPQVQSKSDCCLIHQNSAQLPTITKTAVKFQGSVLGSRKPESEPELRVWPKVLCPSRTGPQVQSEVHQIWLRTRSCPSLSPWWFTSNIIITVTVYVLTCGQWTEVQYLCFYFANPTNICILLKKGSISIRHILGQHTTLWQDHSPSDYDNEFGLFVQAM